MGRRSTGAAATVLAAVAAAGCGSSASKPAPKHALEVASTAQPSPTAAYDPKIVPARFSATITNRYMPLAPGRSWVYTGLKDGVPERVDVRISRRRKTILGVPCVVVSDIVTSNHTLVEKTVDWYSQDAKGDVWYFGEDTKEYANGVVTSTHGTWQAGVDAAKPGIVIAAHPKPGGFYRQEYRPGQAEDMARVLRLGGTQTVPAGTFHGVVETFDKDPLNPDKQEHKWYAPGVGSVHVIRVGSAHHEETSLVKFSG
jgi:hypothetical protein